MDTSDAFAKAWSTHRGFLLGIAYRLLGSYSDAEDVVQEAFARLLRSELDPIEDLRGWLAVVVSRLCFDQLRSARMRHARYAGAHFPEPLIGPPDEGAARGWEVTFTKGEMTSVPRTTPLGYQIINGVYAAIAAYCRAGNNAIVDTVFYDPEALKLARGNFAGLGVLSVGLYCELAEAKRREMSRGDRAPGGAAAFHPLVHLYVRYDLSLDVTYMPAAQAAGRIASAYIRHQTGTAFWAS